LSETDEPATLTLVVDDPEDVDQRADVVLGRRIEGLSRRVARQRALAGALSVDGRRAPPSQRVALGSRLELRLRQVVEDAPPLVVLAETPRLVYVDKPAGVHTVRLRPDDPPTLADVVVAAFPECKHAGHDPLEGGAVHRLDRVTSGVVCFARTREAWDAAREALSSGVGVAPRVTKTYVARTSAALPDTVPLLSAGSVRRITHAAPTLVGVLPDGTPADRGLCIDAPLGASSGPSGAQTVSLSDRGRDAITEVWAITSAPCPAVVLALCTGHRHQARVHLAAVGCPIVGDRLYGDPGGSSPLRLHAAALDLHGVLPDEERVVAPLPGGFWDEP